MNSWSTISRWSNCFFLQSRWPGVSLIRSLSSQEMATALRPFLFAVHPDLFGKYPKKRAINENSLKQLNEYLGKLQQGHRAEPISIHFYLRHLDIDRFKRTTDFESVQISLLSSNIKETVTSVLRSCDLPLDYLMAIKDIPQSKGFPRPVQWHHTYYSHYGIPNPESPPVQPSPLTLHSWLDRNMHNVREKLAAQEPIQNGVQYLLEELQSVAGLSDVLWKNEWGLVQFRSCLRRLLTLVQDNQLKLHDQIIVLGNTSGICINGNIVLRKDDVPQTWFHVISSTGKKHYTDIMGQIHTAEIRLSSLLRGITIKRQQSVIMLATEYLQVVQKLCDDLQNNHQLYPSTHTGTSLSDLDLIIECTSGSVMLSPSGDILVPCTGPAFLILDFLTKNTNKTRHRKIHFQSETGKIELLTEECLQRFGLKSIECDVNVTPDEMKTFCQDCLEDGYKLSVSLNDCFVRVSQFYSVLSDGKICIPWNYRHYHRDPH